MYKALIAIFAILCTACSSRAENDVNNNPDWADLGRYSSENQLIPAVKDGEQRVVFMGNSITENWVKFHPDFFKNNGFIGRGISGQTTPQMLVRFREDVINLNPALVVICAGTNDIAENTGPYNPDVTFGNIVSMVELAKANGIKVVLASLLPAKDYWWNTSIPNVPEKIDALNKRIIDYAANNDIPYADYNSQLKLEPTKELDPSLTYDGVHPNSEGYDVMEAIIMPVITSALAEQQ